MRKLSCVFVLVASAAILQLPQASGLRATGYGISPPFALDTRNLSTGTIVDAFNGRAVRFATVEAIDEGSQQQVDTAETDEDGRYQLYLPPGSTYRLEVSHQGYKHAELAAVSGATEPLPTIEVETRTVVLVHGIFSDHKTWTDEEDGFSFADELQARDPDNLYVIPPEERPLDLVEGSTLHLAWLSGAGSASAQALRLRQYIWDLQREQGIASVDIVAHSMGGLVSRQYLKWGEQSDFGPRVRTLVMLGTPNHGSELANKTSYFLYVLLAYVPAPLWPAVLGLGIAALDCEMRADLSWGSDFLRELNYANQQPALSNEDCRQHPDEDWPNSSTRHVTYAGTTCPEIDCDEWTLSGINLGDKLDDWTNGCPNDGVVPSASVPLRVSGSTPPGCPVYLNWTDVACQCEGGSHFREDCTHMTEDPCVVDAVYRALMGETACEAGHNRPALSHVPEGRDGAIRSPFAEFYHLAPGSSRTHLVQVGSADSLSLGCSRSLAGLALTLSDPAGRPINPDSAVVNPDLEYFAAEHSCHYVIHDVLPGEWALHADAGAIADSVFGLFLGTEYGQVSIGLAMAESELLPGQEQRIEASLLALDVPILNADVVAAITDPNDAVTEFALYDDGTHGDLIPSDGVYTAAIDGNDLHGFYDVSVHAQGVYGDDQTLNSTKEGFYVVQTRPDLDVQDEDIVLALLSADSVRVEATLRNVGGDLADTVRVRFTEAESGIVFSESILTDFQPGEEAQLSGTWGIRHSNQFYGLGVHLDVFGERIEAEMDNNSAFGVLDVADVGSDGSEEQPEDPMAESGLKPMTMRVVPNPFSRGTHLQFSLHAHERVEIAIYDATGRLIRRLHLGDLDPGLHSVTWNARNDGGQSVTSGIYFARLQTASGIRISKLMLLR